MESPYAQQIKKYARLSANCQLAQSVSFIAILISAFITPQVFFISIAFFPVTAIVAKIVSDKVYDLSVKDFKWTAEYYAKQGVQVGSIIKKLE